MIEKNEKANKKVKLMIIFINKKSNIFNNFKLLVFKNKYELKLLSGKKKNNKKIKTLKKIEKISIIFYCKITIITFFNYFVIVFKKYFKII